MVTRKSSNSFRYAHFLRDLELHQTSIEVNIKNYQRELQNLKNCLLKGDRIEPLELFLQQSQVYTEQIAVDLAYLNPGKQLFEQMIAIIRSIVEIEQAKCDRQRQEFEKQRELDEKQRYEEIKEQAEKERERQEKDEKELQDNIQAIGVGITAGTIIASSSGLLSQPIFWPWQAKSGDRATNPILKS